MNWKEKMKNAIDAAAKTSKEIAGAAGAKAQEIGGKALDKAGEIGGKALDKAGEIGGKASGAAKDAAFDLGAKAVILGEKAGEKARDIGEWGALNLEIKKLENQAIALYQKLGFAVFDELCEKGLPNVDSSNPALKDTLAELKEITDGIAAKTGQLDKLKAK